jgi:hypothetical protein
MNLPRNYTQIAMYCANSDDQLITIMYQIVHKNGYGRRQHASDLLELAQNTS